MEDIYDLVLGNGDTLPMSKENVDNFCMGFENKHQFYRYTREGKQERWINYQHIVEVRPKTREAVVPPFIEGVPSK